MRRSGSGAVKKIHTDGDLQPVCPGQVGVPEEELHREALGQASASPSAQRVACSPLDGWPRQRPWAGKEAGALTALVTGCG